jgi:hypothetical protein
MVLGFWSRIGYDSVLPLVAMRGDPGDLNEATALQDAYQLAGFRPVEHVRGIFGDPENLGIWWGAFRAKRDPTAHNQ